MQQTALSQVFLWKAVSLCLSIPHRWIESFLFHSKVTYVRVDSLIYEEPGWDSVDLCSFTGAVLENLIFPLFIFTFVKLYINLFACLESSWKLLLFGLKIFARSILLTGIWAWIPFGTSPRWFGFVFFSSTIIFSCCNQCIIN